MALAVTEKRSRNRKKWLDCGTSPKGNSRVTLPHDEVSTRHQRKWRLLKGTSSTWLLPHFLFPTTTFNETLSSPRRCIRLLGRASVLVWLRQSWSVLQIITSSISFAHFRCLLEYNSWDTAQLQEWLGEHNIKVPKGYTKTELQELVKSNWDSTAAWSQDQYEKAQKSFQGLKDSSFDA